jgi:S-formylglutathione hydrolase
MPPGWNRTEIAGKPAEVFDPGPASLPFALLWLHDEAGESPAADALFAAELGSRRLRCVAPLAPHAWWVGAAERHLLDNVLPWVVATWDTGPRGVAVAGVGMGGQGAVRLGLKHPDRFPIAAGIHAAFDFHERYGSGTPLDDLYPSREHARQDTAVLHVAPHAWPPHLWFACPPASEWYRGNDRLHEKLLALGVPHAADLDTRSAAAELVGPMLAFVAAALDREARRLV